MATKTCINCGETWMNVGPAMKWCPEIQCQEAKKVYQDAGYLERIRAWRERNPEKCREISRNYRKKNLESERKRNREYAQRRRKQDPEKCREIDRRFRKRHPERDREISRRRTESLKQEARQRIESGQLNLMKNQLEGES